MESLWIRQALRQTLKGSDRQSEIRDNGDTLQSRSQVWRTQSASRTEFIKL